MVDSNYDLLCGEHNQLVAAVDAILVAVNAPVRPAMLELNRLRLHLNMLLKAHVQAEQQLILDPLAGMGGTEAIAGAGSVIYEIQAGRAAYSTHAQTWYGRTIEADWDGYSASLTQLIEGLKRTFAREEVELYKPALRLIGHAAPKGMQSRSSRIDAGPAPASHQPPGQTEVVKRGDAGQANLLSSRHVYMRRSAAGKDRQNP